MTGREMLFVPESFRNDHHERIWRVLQGLDFTDTFRRFRFCGGTFASLLCDEYRLSVDLDLLCPSKKHLVELRRVLDEDGPRVLFPENNGPVEVKTRTSELLRFLLYDSDDTDAEPLKVDCFVLDVFPLDRHPQHLGRTGQPAGKTIPCLSTNDLVRCKIKAICDRGLDHSTEFKDIMDLLMLSDRCDGSPTDEDWRLMTKFYGNVIGRFAKTLDDFVRNHSVRRESFDLLEIASEHRQQLYRSACRRARSLADSQVVREEVAQRFRRICEKTSISCSGCDEVHPTDVEILLRLIAQNSSQSALVKLLDVSQNEPAFSILQEMLDRTTVHV